MELTLDQALQKGIEAHKAGKVEEADQYYTAILKANPKHLDANHNMGVLAVGVGKVEQALPFFKTALEVNQTIAQFWLSYIDALIKLDRIEDAKGVFAQSQSKGLQGEGFDQLEQRLLEPSSIAGNVLLSKQESMKKAIELRENGRFDKAIDLLKNISDQFSEDPKVRALLSHCYILKDDAVNATEQLDKAKELDPDMALVCWNEVRLLFKKQNVAKALSIAKNTNNRFPDDVEGISLLDHAYECTGTSKRA